MNNADAPVRQTVHPRQPLSQGQKIGIGVLVEPRYLHQAQPAGMIATLQSCGCDVTLIDPEATLYQAGCDSWLDGLDLVVARGRSGGIFNLLSWAEIRGIPTLNPPAAIAAVHNKIDMGIRLAAAGLPTPRTFFGSITQLTRQLNAADYPLILKPIFGDNCQGIQVIEKPDELNPMKAQETVVLAQSYLPSDGYDLKLYGIGEEIWAVRKPSPLNYPETTLSQPIEAARSAELRPTTPTLQALGRQCGQLFGLELYGVDCIETRQGPVVIEVNEFPNYTSVPQASERLANYVLKREHQHRRKRDENRVDNPAAAPNQARFNHTGSRSVTLGMGRHCRSDLSAGTANRSIQDQGRNMICTFSRPGIHWP